MQHPIKAYLKVRFLLSYFILYSFFTCSCAKSDPVGQKNKLPQKAIILLHGLKGSPKKMARLKQKLAEDFLNVPILDLHRDDSQTSSITEQAKETFEALQKEGFYDKDLVLIGHSQGGLVAYELYRTYGKQLHIQGIITTHTPWEGAPIAATTEKEIEALFQDFKIKIALEIAKKKLKKGVDIKKRFKSYVIAYVQGAGAKDLQPHSNFIQSLHVSLPNAQVPILAIGGFDIEIDEVLSKLFKIPLKKVHKLMRLPKISHDLIKMWAKLVGNEKHDFLVPLYSQIAENIPTSSTFSRKQIAKHHHYASLTDPAVYPTIIQTIQTFFSSNQQPD